MVSDGQFEVFFFGILGFRPYIDFCQLHADRAAGGATLRTLATPGVRPN
jgi:hypothetical protein